MKVYISGKITGYPEAKKRFEDAEIQLQLQGHQTINPHQIGSMLPELLHSEYMEVSFALIDAAEAVFFLSNWKESPGACMEYGYTKAKGKKILFE